MCLGDDKFITAYYVIPRTAPLCRILLIFGRILVPPPILLLLLLSSFSASSPLSTLNDQYRSFPSVPVFPPQLIFFPLSFHKAHETVARRVCQHVVGMNPATLGDINDEVVKREMQDDTFDIEVKEGEDEHMVSAVAMVLLDCKVVF